MHVARGLEHLRRDPGASAIVSESLTAQRHERAGMAWTWAGVEAAANCAGHLIFGYSNYHGCADSSQGLAVNAVLLGTNLVLGLKNLGLAVGSRRVMSAALAQQANEPDPLERRAIANRAFALTRGLRTEETLQAFAQLALGMTYFASLAFTIDQASREGSSLTFANLPPLLKGHAYACVTAGAAAALQGVYEGFNLGERAENMRRVAGKAWRAWRQQPESV